MISMIFENVIPDAKKAELDTTELVLGADQLKQALAKVHALESTEEKAHACRVLRLETMNEVRTVCDEIEAKVPAEMWSMASYKELLFLDMHPSHKHTHTPAVAAFQTTESSVKQP